MESNLKTAVQQPLRVVFWGSSEDAVQGLRALARREGLDVRAACTRGDRPAGRGQAALKELGADAFVIMAYGRILPPEVLSLPRLGSVNVHPSLLPKHRGPSPVATAILEGAPETGVTLMLADEGLDSGPLLRSSAPIAIPPDATCADLQRKLFGMGAEMLPQALRDLDAGALKPQPQDEAQATWTKLLEKGDGEIDWRRPAEEIGRMARAYFPWPGAFTWWRGRRLKVLAATPEAAQALEAGAVALADGAARVGCGRGALRLERVQLAGGRALEGHELANGLRQMDGAVLPS